MKKLSLSITIGLISFSLISQHSLSGNISFNKQEQIDNFQFNYPACKEIEGDVTINGTDITNLSGLSSLIAIYGDFDIIHNPNLKSLTGLEKLSSIGGTLSMWRNDILTNLSGLNNLKSLKGIFLFSNHSLTSLAGLENITAIGNVDVGNNRELYSLKGLHNIESIRENLFIYENNSLVCLTGLNNLKSVGGSVYIWCNISLLNLKGLNSLTSIEKSLVIEFNDVLESISELNNLLFLSNLEIRFNARLTHITGLENISAIDNITIKGNTLLVDITGLENLTHITGNLIFGGMETFPLGEVCYANPSFRSFNGLNNVSSIDGDLVIIGNDSLQNLAGFESLTTIGGSLLIGNWYCHNSSLQSLSGLDNLTYIGENLAMVANKKLTSISALENVLVIGGDIEITNNWFLNNCDIHSICKNLYRHTGTITIRQNAPGCNSIEEINKACGDQEYFDISFKNGSLTISPNPFSTSTTLKYELQLPEQISLKIYNQIGEQVYHFHDNQLPGKQQLIWNAEGNADGVYFFGLQVGDQISNGKIVLMR